MIWQLGPQLTESILPCKKMPWKENTKPHLSENIGSEQRGDRSVRGRGRVWGLGARARLAEARQ